MRKIFAIILLFCLFNYSLLGGRILYSGSISYVFLAWNLFLAGIPLLVGALLYKRRRTLGSLALFAGVSIWLIFLPNSPYILTDLFHLAIRPPMPLWFDLGLILSFSLNALLMGYISIFLVSRIIENRFSIRISNAFVYMVFFLSAFGVYIGRYLRWNSWDILSNPLAVLWDIGQPFLDPMGHPRAWGLTLLYSVTLILTYHLVISLGRISQSEEKRN